MARSPFGLIGITILHCSKARHDVRAPSNTPSLGPGHLEEKNRFLRAAWRSARPFYDINDGLLHNAQTLSIAVAVNHKEGPSCQTPNGVSTQAFGLLRYGCWPALRRRTPTSSPTRTQKLATSRPNIR